MVAHMVTAAAPAEQEQMEVLPERMVLPMGIISPPVVERTVVAQDLVIGAGATAGVGVMYESTGQHNF